MRPVRYCVQGEGEDVLDRGVPGKWDFILTVVQLSLVHFRPLTERLLGAVPCAGRFTFIPGVVFLGRE